MNNPVDFWGDEVIHPLKDGVNQMHKYWWGENGIEGSLFWVQIEPLLKEIGTEVRLNHWWTDL